ncbi:hypothetical protein PVL30_005040 [Lodderomyces elongisporus]|uniref:uncharacterized protein n=1 Tax=Lodderomyces elongisporus TaxID=36914 RepID=UPI0029212A1F|nr:uncharacterized protein PVL30_005040 [Lodderomyces elongisporus]WLF81243.1 hypothetical protein PVL30_005040 [Lodderomyces elongisporus]
MSPTPKATTAQSQVNSKQFFAKIPFSNDLLHSIPQQHQQQQHQQQRQEEEHHKLHCNRQYYNHQRFGKKDVIPNSYPPQLPGYIHDESAFLPIVSSIQVSPQSAHINFKTNNQRVKNHFPEVSSSIRIYPHEQQQQQQHFPSHDFEFYSSQAATITEGLTARISHKSQIKAFSEKNASFYFPQKYGDKQRPASQPSFFAVRNSALLANILDSDIHDETVASKQTCQELSFNGSVIHNHSSSNYYCYSHPQVSESGDDVESLKISKVYKTGEDPYPDPLDIPNDTSYRTLPKYCNGIELVPDQSFLTITSNCMPENLEHLLQEHGNIYNQSVVSNGSYRNCQSQDSDKTTTNSICMPKFETQQVPYTNSDKDTVLSRDEYTRFVLDSSKAPIDKSCFVGSDANGNKHKNRPSNPDLTHDEIVDSFEETCTQNDDWKTALFKNRIRKLNSKKRSRGKCDQSELVFDINDSDNHHDNQQSHNHFKEGDVDEKDNIDRHLLPNATRLKLKTELDPLVSSSSPLVHPEMDNAYLMNIVEEWRRIGLNQDSDVSYGNSPICDSSHDSAHHTNWEFKFDHPVCYNYFSAGTLLNSGKRTSSISSLSDNSSQLSLQAKPINPLSTLSSPLDKAITPSSGVLSPPKRTKPSSSSLAISAQQKQPRKNQYNVIPTFNNNFNRSFFETTNVDLAQLNIKTVPDLEYSAQLPTVSANIPDAEHCIKLQEKLIRPLFTPLTCRVKRTMYLRDSLIDTFRTRFEHVYELTPNANFKKTAYESQYILTKVDKSGVPDNATRAGLCPYCESVEFFGLKNSSYGNHLAYKHGILTNGRAVPDPKFHGLYKFRKGEYDEPEKKKRKTNAHMLEREGVLCTTCWRILEVNCTSRSSVLGHYLRHFRDSHVGYKKEGMRTLKGNQMPLTGSKDVHGNNTESVEDAYSKQVKPDPIVLAFLNNWNLEQQQQQ